MIKTLILSFSFLFIIEIYPQSQPESFELPGDKNFISKTTASNPTSNSILDIVTIEDQVWLGTSRGVSVSFNRGFSWTNFYGSSPFGDDNISALAYNKYDGSIWAATATSVPGPGGGNVPKGTGLKFTTDGGATWTAVPQPVDHPDSSVIIFGENVLSVLPITVAEQNLTYDIAFTTNAVWITSFAGGTRRSTNMGQTWQRIILPTDSLNSISPSDSLSERDKCISPTAGNFCSTGWLNYRAFSVVAANDSTVYVGTANGINKTTNAFAQNPSWIKYNHQNQNQPISGNFITALGYNLFNNTIWASSWKAEDANEFYAISYSANGGNIWKTALNEERGHNFGFKNADVIALTDNGAFRSLSQGRTWILPNNIVDKESGVELTTSIFYSAASDDEYVWLGSNDGLARIIETSAYNGDWKVYFASQPLKSEEETYCYPNPFSPRQEQLKIKYSTGGAEAEVTIRIFDFGMNYIRTIIQNASRNRTLEGAPEFWDGLDDNGNYLPNGVYIYRVDINDEEPLFGKIIYMQ
ncbi:MAG: hypothetical protein IH618_07875 [Ignavibacteriaceae bacterium]|nr:hypothetical protein [Ignavibacteriaceae bacterium]